MIDKININEIIKNGGATLDKNYQNIKEKNGYMVSIMGMEKTFPLNQLEELKDNIEEYQKILKNNEYIGLWVENELIYLDISKHYKDLKQAKKMGIYNKQLAIYDIANNKNIYLTKNLYIIYKLDKINNDLQYIKEYEDIKEIQKDYNIKNGYQYIIEDIEKIQDSKILNDRYIIFKDSILINEI